MNIPLNFTNKLLNNAFTYFFLRLFFFVICTIYRSFSKNARDKIAQISPRECTISKFRYYALNFDWTSYFSVGYQFEAVVC